MLWWASAGVLLLVFQVVVLARWVSGPNFTATDPGPDKLPAWQSVVFTVLQVGIPVGAVVLIYFWVIRPWRRHRYLTTEAMIALSASTVFFWDMVMNYTSVTLFYNSHLVNRGAWANGAWPTWTSPHANKLPEPLLIVPPAYTALVFSQVIVVLWLLRKVKARWPGVGVVGIVLTIVVGLTLTDTLVEGLVLRTGAYAYPGGIRAITLFAGQTYQIPLSETVLFGGFALGAIACLSYFRDDRGHTLVERGISTLKLNFKSRQAVKFFAIYGAIHLGFVVLGVFSFTQQGLDGAVYQMLNHGISTGALFVLVGFMYERRHSLEIVDYRIGLPDGPTLDLRPFDRATDTTPLPGDRTTKMGDSAQ